MRPLSGSGLIWKILAVEKEAVSEVREEGALEKELYKKRRGNEKTGGKKGNGIEVVERWVALRI